MRTSSPCLPRLFCIAVASAAVACGGQAENNTQTRVENLAPAENVESSVPGEAPFSSASSGTPLDPEVQNTSAGLASAMTCAAPRDLGGQLGAVAQGDLRCAPMQLQGDCGGEGPEHVFSWTAPKSAAYSFDTFGSDFDTVLYLMPDGPCPAPNRVCNDDEAGPQSSAELYLEEGEKVQIVVDTYAFETGTYVLNIDYARLENCPADELGSQLGNDLVDGEFDEVTSEYAGPCGGLGPEHSFAWKAPHAGQFTLSTEGSSFDTVLTVRNSCGGPVTACNDDATDVWSELTLQLEQDQEVVIFVDTFDTMDQEALPAHYSLSILDADD